ncbi:unnamed protein product [Closterium sp. Naga37s-1]|nr:unnamed protein product [Closterium sp. Naga37s-1]
MGISEMWKTRRWTRRAAARNSGVEKSDQHTVARSGKGFPSHSQTSPSFPPPSNPLSSPWVSTLCLTFSPAALLLTHDLRLPPASLRFSLSRLLSLLKRIGPCAWTAFPCTVCVDRLSLHLFLLLLLPGRLLTSYVPLLSSSAPPLPCHPTPTPSSYGVDVVQRSFAFDPPLHRFLVLLAKLLAGRPLTVVAVGGSISAAGHLPGGVMHGTGTYGQALVDWLQQWEKADWYPSFLLPSSLSSLQGSTHLVLPPLPSPSLPARALRLPSSCFWHPSSPNPLVSPSLLSPSPPQVFPTPPSTPPHRLIRAFLPGAGSYVLHFCTGELVGALWADGDEQRRAAGEADVVLLECAANDWSVLQPGMALPPAHSCQSLLSISPLSHHTPPEGTQYAAAEGLLRQFLLLPSHPLVLFLNFGVFHPRDPLLSAFHHSAEALLNHLSAYYSVPAVSPWRAYFPLVATAASPTCPASAEPPSEPAAKPRVLSPPSSEPAENLTWAHMFVDRVHPSAAGHGMAGSLAAHRIFSLALHYLRREGLAVSRHHLRLDWVDGKAAPSTQSALLCPPTSLCRKCFGDLGFSALGPPLSAPCMLPPLQSAADPHPRCVLGNTWNVTAVGAMEFHEGYTAVREAASKGDAASVKRIAEANASWVQEACGPLVPQILCWKAQIARAPLRVAVDVRGAAWGIGVVYKMLDWQKQEHKMDGADVKVNGRDVGFLPVPVVGNTLTHWRLNSSLIRLEDGEVREGHVSLTIVPRTKWFHMVALVVE